MLSLYEATKQDEAPLYARFMSLNRKQIALQTVLEAFDVASLARKSEEKKWDEYFRLANGIVDKVKYKWKTNRFIPYTQTILDLIHPRLAGKKPSAGIVGRNEGSSLKQDKFEKLIEYQQDELNIETLLADWIYDSSQNGTSYLEVGWKKETSENIGRTQGFLDKIKSYFSNIGITAQNDDLLYDGPTVENCDIYDIFVDPKAKTIEDAQYVIKRTENTKYKLKSNPNYKKEDINELKSGDAEIDQYRKNRLTSLGMSNSQAQQIVSNISSNYHEVLTYWGLFDIDGDGDDEKCKIEVIGRSKVLVMEENPHYTGKKPFIKLNYKRRPHFFYGEGLVERIKSSQYELNDIYNQASDMRKLTLAPVIKIRRDANIDIETLKIAPNLPIPLDDPEKDVIFDRPPDFTSQLEFVGKSTRELMQVATGANDVVLGQMDVGIGSNTARGAELASEQSSLRFRMPSLNIDIGIEELGNWFIDLNQQYFDRKKQIRVLGDEGITYPMISPKDISGQFVYKIQTQSTMPQSKVSRRTELVNVKQLFMNNPKVDQDALDKMILESFDLNPETIITQEGGMDIINEMKSKMNPEQIQAFMGKLNPQDQQIMTKALNEIPATSPSIG